MDGGLEVGGRVGHFQNVFAASVILFELDDGGARIVTLEVEDIADLRASPSVDALIVIADDCNVSRFIGEREDELELGAVCILELIDHEVVESAPPFFADVFARMENANGGDDEIVEIEGAHPAQLVFVDRIDGAGELIVIEIALGHLLGRHERVFVERDAREDGGNIDGAIGDALAADDLLDEPHRVALIHDDEAIFVAERFGLLAQKTDAEAMEG